MVKRTYVIEVEIETGRKKDLPDGASVAGFLAHALHEAQKDELPDFNRDDYRVSDPTVWKCREDYLADHALDGLAAQAERKRKIPPHVQKAARKFADILANATPEDWAKAEKEASKHMLDEPPVTD